MSDNTFAILLIVVGLLTFLAVHPTLKTSGFNAYTDLRPNKTSASLGFLYLLRYAAGLVVMVGVVWFLNKKTAKTKLFFG